MFCRVLLFALCFGWFATDLMAQPAPWYPPHHHMPSPYPYPYPYPNPYPYPYPNPYPTHWNPTIAQSRNHFDGFHYDPTTGRWTVDTTQNKLKESATDPNRAHIDPGSYRPVDRWQGNTHVTGFRWTSYGVPHSNLQYHTVGPSGIPGINHSQTTNVFRGTGPGEGGTPPNPAAGNTGAKELHKKWDLDGNGSLNADELAKGLSGLKSPK